MGAAVVIRWPCISGEILQFFPTIIHKLPSSPVKESAIDIFGPPPEIVSHHSNFSWIYSWMRTCPIYFCLKFINSHSRCIISNSFELVRGNRPHLQSCALYYFLPHTNMVCSQDRVLWLIPACEWLWSQRKWACAVPSFLFPLISHIALKKVGQ